MVVFTLLAFSLSWGYWGVLLAQGLRVTPDSGVSHLPGLIGPALAAIATTALFHGRTGLHGLFSGFWGWPRRPDSAFALGTGATARWRIGLLLALFAPPVLSLGTVALSAMITDGGLPPLSDFTAYPGLLPGWTSLTALVAVLLLNGAGEELGWRGFALDRLAQRHGRLRGTLILALIWAAWHLPLFWLNVTMAALVGPMLFGWLFSLACGAFALADLYWSSGRRLWLVILWHVLYNAVVATPATNGLPAAVASAFVVLWGLDAARRFHLWDRADPVSQPR